MKHSPKLKRRKSDEGAALLIAIFALLLISVIAIALVVSSGTDSALQSNYRTSTGAYYAALAGVEEGRGRLLWKNPDCLINRTVTPNCPNPTFIATAPAGNMPAMGLTDVRYILNPAGGETVDPTSASPSNYPDNEYQNEFGWALSSADVQTTTTVSTTAGLPGPLYKWVRITPVTEKSVGLNVDSNPPPLNTFTPLQYDPALQGLTRTASATSGQALQVTALAVLPNNTQKLLQYVIAPLLYGLPFPPPPGPPPPLNYPGALVLSGSGTASPGVSFQVPTSAGAPPFQISGNDGTGPNSAMAGCTPTAPVTYAIGVTDSAPPANYDAILAAIPAAVQGNYTGEVPAHHHHHGSSLSVESNPSLSSTMMSPNNLNLMVQTISQNADVVVNHNATDADMPGTMSATNPMTVVVNGNLTLTNFTGYGLLVVTGDFVSNPNAGWRGMVLVVGSGNVTFTGGAGGNGEYDGGMFIAQTMDMTQTPPVPSTTMGTATFNALNAGGDGIFYNSCWINTALKPPTFKVLSFREITPP